VIPTKNSINRGIFLQTLCITITTKKSLLLAINNILLGNYLIKFAYNSNRMVAVCRGYSRRRTTVKRESWLWDFVNDSTRSWGKASW